MKTLNTLAWLCLIVLFTVQPADRALWVLLMLAAAIVCYITKNEPDRTRNTDKPKR